jgi:hypothetical protein
LARVERSIFVPPPTPWTFAPLLIIAYPIGPVPSSLKGVLRKETAAMYIYAALKKSSFEAYSGFNQVIST